MHHTCGCTDGQHQTPSLGYHNPELADIVARHTGRHIVTVEVSS